MEAIKEAIIKFNIGVGGDLLKVAIFFALIKIIFTMISLYNREEVKIVIRDIFLYLIAIAFIEEFSNFALELPTYISSNFSFSEKPFEELAHKYLGQKSIKYMFIEWTGEGIVSLRTFLLATVKYIRSWFVLGCLCFFSIVLFFSTIGKQRGLGVFYVFMLISTALYPIIFSLVDNLYLTGLEGAMKNKSDGFILAYSGLACLLYVTVPVGAIKGGMILISPAIGTAKHLLSQPSGASKALSLAGKGAHMFNDMFNRSGKLNSGRFGDKGYRQAQSSHDEYREEKMALMDRVKARRRSGVSDNGRDEAQFKEKWSHKHAPRSKSEQIKEIGKSVKNMAIGADSVINYKKNKNNKHNGINNKTVRSREEIKKSIQSKSDIQSSKNSNNKLNSSFSIKESVSMSKTKCSASTENISMKTNQITRNNSKNNKGNNNNGYRDFIKTHSSRKEMNQKQIRREKTREELEKRRKGRGRTEHVTRRV